MNATSNALAAGVTIANRFRLVNPLRKGGMGSVWVATHTTLGTEVAIKFIDIHGDSSDALRRFEREANVVARLRSPHVVQILDYGVDEAGRPYLAMELLHGESLKERLDRTKTLRLEEVATVVIQTCRALHRAHKAGIVHRDIKPANLFLSEEDEALHVKVLDFGVAKASSIVPGPSDAQKTETGAIVGTPAYMSPEQVLASEEIDGRSDLFSLGVLAWRMLVGVNPHERDGKPLGFGELLIQIATRPVAKPSELVEGISPEVDAWFAHALAIDRAMRFTNAKEMAEALAVAMKRSFHLAGTGAYAAASADVSGNIEAATGAFHDSDDVSAPAEIAALRREDLKTSGERSIARAPAVGPAIDTDATNPKARPKKAPRIAWIAVGAGIVVVAWFVLGRSTSRPEPARVDAPPARTIAATPSPPAPAADVPPAAPTTDTAPTAAPVAATAAPVASTPIAPRAASRPNAAPPRVDPHGPHSQPKTGPNNDAATTPHASPNTLLDDRL